MNFTGPHVYTIGIMGLSSTHLSGYLNYITDSNGFTLYPNTEILYDQNQWNLCTGSNLSISGAVKSSLLRNNYSSVLNVYPVAYWSPQAGLTYYLYRYSGDTSPGQKNGLNIPGTYLLDVTGQTIET